jgi:hypothetical protein
MRDDDGQGARSWQGIAVAASPRSLNRPQGQPAQMVSPFSGIRVLERPPPGMHRIPDVMEGVAQDRKRQEP